MGDAQVTVPCSDYNHYVLQTGTNKINLKF